MIEFDSRNNEACVNRSAKLNEIMSIPVQDRKSINEASRKIGAVALGAVAIGALALGAMALGVLAIGRLAIGRARIGRLEIDELIVRKHN